MNDHVLNVNYLGSGTGCSLYSGLNVKLKRFRICVVSNETLFLDSLRTLDIYLISEQWYLQTGSHCVVILG